jgi:hypothetical protein
VYRRPDGPISPAGVLRWFELGITRLCYRKMYRRFRTGRIEPDDDFGSFTKVSSEENQTPFRVSLSYRERNSAWRRQWAGFRQRQSVKRFFG